MAINIIVLATSAVLLCYWLRTTWTLIVENEAERRRFARPSLGELAPVTAWNAADGPRRLANHACISHLP